MKPKQLRQRGTEHFDKPPLSLDELVARLEQRGLRIDDHDRARRYLKHIGYYRLSPYSLPLQANSRGHTFKAGHSFDDLLDLYIFDRELRLLVLDALERIEVALRSALTDHMANKYHDAHWYTQAGHFKSDSRHESLLIIVRDKCEERLTAAAEAGHDQVVFKSALEHYLTKYVTPELPPSWLMVETLTIGQLERLIGNLAESQDKAAIASALNLRWPVLESWTRSFVRVRNVCAHHGRLWNVGLGTYPMVPKSKSIPWPRGQEAVSDRSRQRLYPVLLALQSMLKTLSPGSAWALRLEQLLSTRSKMHLYGMGIPEDWAEHDFWKPHLRRQT